MESWWKKYILFSTPTIVPSRYGSIHSSLWNYFYFFRILLVLPHTIDRKFPTDYYFNGALGLVQPKLSDFSLHAQLTSKLIGVVYI